VVRISISEINLGQALVQTVEALKKGCIVAYPTETFYGLGVKFDLEDSLKRLYDLKKRARDKAMPLIFGDERLLPLVARSANRSVLALMTDFWPGPLTLILRSKNNISGYVTAGTGKVAVRIREVFALSLAQRPIFITATSANLSGHDTRSKCRTVIGYFGDEIDILIDVGLRRGLPQLLWILRENENSKRRGDKQESLNESFKKIS
jgi:L-threonylcarbamoyladenylate synthase